MGARLRVLLLGQKRRPLYEKRLLIARLPRKHNLGRSHGLGRFPLDEIESPHLGLRLKMTGIEIDRPREAGKGGS